MVRRNPLKREEREQINKYINRQSMVVFVIPFDKSFHGSLPLSYLGLVAVGAAYLIHIGLVDLSHFTEILQIGYSIEHFCGESSRISSTVSGRHVTKITLLNLKIDQVGQILTQKATTTHASGYSLIHMLNMMTMMIIEHTNLMEFSLTLCSSRSLNKASSRILIEKAIESNIDRSI